MTNLVATFSVRQLKTSSIQCCMVTAYVTVIQSKECYFFGGWLWYLCKYDMAYFNGLYCHLVANLSNTSKCAIHFTIKVEQN